MGPLRAPLRVCVGLKGIRVQGFRVFGFGVKGLSVLEFWHMVFSGFMGLLEGFCFWDTGYFEGIKRLLRCFKRTCRLGLLGCQV